MPGGLEKRQARFIILLIWTLALLVYLPWLFTFTIIRSPKFKMEFCAEIWPPNMSGALYFLLANLILSYFVPLAAISITNLLIWYHVARRQIPQGSAPNANLQIMHKKTKAGVQRMLSVVTLVFMLSWLPLYASFLRLEFGGEVSPDGEAFFTILRPVAQWMGASSSSVNPIVYGLLNKKLRSSFMSLLFKRDSCHYWRPRDVSANRQYRPDNSCAYSNSFNNSVVCRDRKISVYVRSSHLRATQV